MKERRLILDQQLRQFEAEKASIAEAIFEINRRFAVLDEIQSWKLLPEHEETAENPGTDQLDNELVREPVISYSR